MKKSFKSILILVTLIVLLILYLINSRLIIENTINYSILFFTKIFPVSFIFFVFSYLLINLGLIEFINKSFNTNSSKLYVLLLSIISGFPSGSKYTKDLLDRELITLEDARKIIMFSHFPNPLFVLGSVSYVFTDKSICIKILISIILSNIIIYIFVGKCSKKDIRKTVNNDSFSNILGMSINNSLDTIMLIYGISLFFYLISFIITNYLFINTYFYILVCGLFDLTNGVFSTSLISNDIIKAIIILFFISFGGISIHMQVNSIISSTNINYKYFLKGRIIGSFLSLIIFILIIRMGIH